MDFGTETVQIDVDSRGRVTLGKLAGTHRHFLGTLHDDGSIVLQPAVVRPLLEDRLLSDPSIADTVRTGLASEKRVRRRSLERRRSK